MNSIVQQRERGSGAAATDAVLESKLFDARYQLDQHDEAVRVKAIAALGRIKHEGALETAIHVFQACATGAENLAAQRSIVQLCGVFPEHSAETAVRLTTLISGRVQDGALTLISREFARSCDTVEAVLSPIRLNGDALNQLHSVIGNWYERIKVDFRAAPTEFTLADPRQLAAFQQSSMPEAYRRSMFAVQSMAMLAKLMEGIHTPKATEIKKELLSQIEPDGFGEYVLKPLSSHQSPELQDAVVEVLERWVRSATTPPNRLVLVCAALAELLRSQSSR